MNMCDSYTEKIERSRFELVFYIKMEFEKIKFAIPSIRRWNWNKYSFSFQSFLLFPSQNEYIHMYVKTPKSEMYF